MRTRPLSALEAASNLEDVFTHSIILSAATAKPSPLPTRPLAQRLLKCLGGCHLPPPAPPGLPLACLPRPGPLASALSGFLRGTAGLCYMPAPSSVPCISVLVLNSLSEQLDNHMGLYGVGCLSLAPAEIAGNTPRAPAVSPAAHSSHRGAWLTRPQPTGLLKALSVPCPHPVPAEAEQISRDLSAAPGLR